MKRRLLLLGIIALTSCQSALYDFYFQSAERYFSNGDLPRAVEMYLKAIREDSREPEAYYGLALAHYRMGNYEDALYAFEKTIELDPKNYFAQERLASVYLDLDIPDSAIVLCASVLQKEREFPGALNTLGHALLALGQIDSAEKTFSASVSLCRNLNERYGNSARSLPYGPEESEAFNGLGEIEFTRGLYSHAVASFDAAIALSPYWDRPWFNKAVAYGASGRFSAAMVAYQRTIDLSRANLPAYRAYARLLMQSNLESDAVDLLLRALRVDSTDAYSSYVLGEIYERRGEYSQAFKVYEHVLSIYPDDPVAYVRRGRLQFRQNRIEEAIRSFREALAIQPENAAAYNGLGEVYRSMGKTSEAEMAFRSAVDCDSTLVSSLVGLGGLLLEQGKRDEGLDLYARAAALGDGSAREFLRTQLGRKDR